MLYPFPPNCNPWLLLNRYGLPTYNDLTPDHFTASPSRTRPQPDIAPILPILPITRSARPRAGDQGQPNHHQHAKPRTRDELLADMQRTSDLLQIRHMDRPFAQFLADTQDTARRQHRLFQANSRY